MITSWAAANVQGHRWRAALPQRRGPGHRGRHRRWGAQPNARPGTPELRPRRL